MFSNLSCFVHCFNSQFTFFSVHMYSSTFGGTTTSVKYVRPFEYLNVLILDQIFNKDPLQYFHGFFAKDEL